MWCVSHFATNRGPVAGDGANKNAVFIELKNNNQHDVVFTPSFTALFLSCFRTFGISWSLCIVSDARIFQTIKELQISVFIGVHPWRIFLPSCFAPYSPKSSK